jgi:blocked-early-in-transport protein 1
VLSELESQNDEQVEGMSARVKMLKDVRLSSFTPLSSFSFPSFPLYLSLVKILLVKHKHPLTSASSTQQLTTAIGEEIRDSSKLAESMNDSFDNTRVRLRGTMNRMLRMAEKTGVGWRVWLAFFAAVGLLFWYVWLF